MARIRLGLVTACKGVWNTGLGDHLVLKGVPFSLIRLSHARTSRPATPASFASSPTTCGNCGGLCHLRELLIHLTLKCTEPMLTASITSYLYY